MTLGPPRPLIARLKLDRGQLPTLPREVWHVIDQKLALDNVFAVDYSFHPVHMQRMLKSLTDLYSNDAFFWHHHRRPGGPLIPLDVATFYGFDIEADRLTANRTLLLQLNHGREHRIPDPALMKYFNDERNTYGVSMDLAYQKIELLVSLYQREIEKIILHIALTKFIAREDKRGILDLASRAATNCRSLPEADTGGGQRSCCLPKQDRESLLDYSQTHHRSDAATVQTL